jgi:integrase
MPRASTGAKLIIRRQSGVAEAVYYIVWTEGRRSKKKSTGISVTDPDAQTAAQESLRQWLREDARAKQTKGRNRADQVKVSDVIEEYVRDHQGDVASAETLLGSCRPLSYFFADDTMETLTTNRVKAYWKWRRDNSLVVTDKATGAFKIIERNDDAPPRFRKPIAVGTIIRELGGALRPAIEHAIKEKRLVPGKYFIPVPSAPAGRDYWITRKEAARLLRETRRDKRARLHLPLYTLIALYTGARRQAILDLTWTQIDLVAGTIDLNPPGRAQTKKRRPIIRITRSLRSALRRAQARASSAFVIAYNGLPVKDVKTGFNSAAERAGIPDCSSNTLRHTAGTWMAQRGVPLWQIAGWLGHSDARTSELYAHHSPEHLAEALSAMEGGR